MAGFVMDGFVAIGFVVAGFGVGVWIWEQVLPSSSKYVFIFWMMEG